MKILYQNTCPAWHDTKKISKDKWLQNTRGEGASSNAGGLVVYPDTRSQFHDGKNVTLQKMNQIYCAGASGGTPEPPPDLLTDLLAYWRMEESGLNNREDSHTNNLDLTPNGSAPQVTGIIDFGVRLSGSPGFDLANHDPVFDIVGAATIAGWVKFNTVITPAFLVGKVDTEPPDPGLPTEGYMLYVNTSSRLAYWHGNGIDAAEAEDSTVLATGVWYFVVCGFQGGTQFIQVNNNTRTSIVGVSSTPGLFQFTFGGARSLTLSGPNADFDEFGVWTRMLSTAEASYLYNSGAGRTYPL